MMQFIRYYGSYRDVRSRLTTMPSWARAIVGLAALPGLALIGLSILLFLVSLSALLLLTVPVYRVLRFICISPAPRDVIDEPDPHNVYVTSGRRAIDVKIVE